MKYYDEIVHRLYIWETKIGDTEFEPFDYIEAKHNEATYKGKVFYQNIINAMPNHFGAKMRNEFFKEVLHYCKQKINAIQYEFIQSNIVFRELQHTVVTVCEFVKPIYTTIEPLKYIEYFLSEIDFDKIETNNNKAETLKYCNAIYYGLEQLLKADISKAILNYQNNISKLSKEQIQETQINLIELIGNLKRQARTNEVGISFTQRYNSLFNSIKAKESLFSIDYQILISHFNETILNDLLSSFEIINETFKEITPLLKAFSSQQTETKTDKIKAELGKYGFFELPKVKQLSEHSKQSLIELISTNGLPYSIAMFDLLGFLNYIENEHFKTKYKLNKEIAKWFNSDKEGRAVKGNVSTLSDYSKENKSKYTAHTHKETVKIDYQKLK